MANIYEDEVRLDAPAGLWRLDEAAGVFADRSGNGIDLTAVGTLTRAVAGAVNNINACEFHAGYARCEQAAALDPTTGITMEVWIFLPAGWASFWGVMSKTIGNLPDSKAEIYVDDHARVNFNIQTTTTNATVQASPVLPLNQWNLVAATWDGTNVRWTINGAGAGLVIGGFVYPVNGLLLTGVGRFYVGSLADGSFNPNAGGRLQYPAQYSTALSASRLYAHYHAQNNPATPNTPQPANGSNGVPLSQSLSWVSAGAQTYDVYFGTTNPPPLVVADLGVAAYGPPLNNGVIYYWQIVAKAGAGANQGANVGPIWTFQVIQAANPSFGLIHAFRMAPTGNANALLIDDQKWNAAHKAPPFVIFTAAEAVAIAWNAQPNPETPFRNGFSYPDVVANLQYATQGRLIVNVATAGAAGAQLRVKAAPLATAVFAYPDGNNGFAVLIDSIGLKDSGWVNLSNAMISAGELEFALFGILGNGVAAPAFGLILFMVR